MINRNHSQSKIDLALGEGIVQFTLHALHYLCRFIHQSLSNSLHSTSSHSNSFLWVIHREAVGFLSLLEPRCLYTLCTLWIALTKIKSREFLPPIYYTKSKRHYSYPRALSAAMWSVIRALEIYGRERVFNISILLQLSHIYQRAP